MQRQRLRTRSRLTGRNGFGPVFRARTVQTNAWFLIHYSAPLNQATSGPRLGIGVTRKVHTSAVVRNRVRRLIRESFRLRQFRIVPQDYVVRARPAAAHADNATLRQALDQLWNRFELE
ncbi:MAG: ribonuclease P protein component [Pseudomonadota bacterium]